MTRKKPRDNGHPRKTETGAIHSNSHKNNNQQPTQKPNKAR